MASGLMIPIYSHPLKETIVMNKFVLSTLAATALLGAAGASQAQVFTYELVTGATAYTTFPGVSATTTNDPGITDFFAPAATVSNPQSYAVPSVLKFGDDTTTPGAGAANTTATFSAVPISFDFMVDSGSTIGATAHSFTVTGSINGAVGYDSTSTPFSRAKVTYSTIKDNTTGQTDILSTDPQNTLPALLISTHINGSSVAIYLDISQSKPIPGDLVTHVGFIAAHAAVPEPGSVAMMVGMSVSGTAFLLRKRRRA
jgi:hypothetical protein